MPVTLQSCTVVSDRRRLFPLANIPPCIWRRPLTVPAPCRPVDRVIRAGTSSIRPSVRPSVEISASRWTRRGSSWSCTSKCFSPRDSGSPRSSLFLLWLFAAYSSSLSRHQTPKGSSCNRRIVCRSRSKELASVISYEDCVKSCRCWGKEVTALATSLDPDRITATQ